MKLLKTTLVALVLIVTTASCTKDETQVVEEANFGIDVNLAMETDWQMADEILTLVNEYRTSIGLSALKRDQQYASAYAVDHTQYMIDISKINHDNFGVRSKALKDRGAQSVGENVAMGYTKAENLVNAWLNSPSHRGVIEGNYTHSGFGVIQNDRGIYYFTQLFYRK
ncbi:MAG: CAP domain-containing protein [Bacteroidia bacterium]|nr:CAP domain-containing protein [Bacteroidia bacterium]NNM23461.1 CAP domain-containing protein [Flavobacteriaceae bacterium]